MPQKSIEQYERELMEMYRLALARDPNYASLAQRHSAVTVRESIPEEKKVDVEIPAPDVEESVPLPERITPVTPEQPALSEEITESEEIAMSGMPAALEQTTAMEMPDELGIAIVGMPVAMEQTAAMEMPDELGIAVAEMPVALEQTAAMEMPDELGIAVAEMPVMLEQTTVTETPVAPEQTTTSVATAVLEEMSVPKVVAVSETPEALTVDSVPPVVAVILPTPEMVTHSEQREQTQKLEQTEMIVNTNTETNTDTTTQMEVVSAPNTDTDAEAEEETPPARQQMPARQQVPADMGRATTQPTFEAPRRTTQTPNIGAGNLIVNVTMQNRTKPVADAMVTVSHPEASGNKVVAKAMTDSSGKTELIRLPAPIREIPVYPQPMTGGDLSATYLVTVEAPGFEAVSDEEVSIFDGVTSVKRIDLTGDVNRMADDENGTAAENSSDIQRE